MNSHRPELLREVLLITPEVHEDIRGHFLEAFQRERYASVGIEDEFVQDNHSRSRENVLRGLHFQHPRPQGKLIRVVRGAIFDVAVDIRRGSPTFGRWFGTRLDDVRHRQLWVPPDFAHGFVTLTETADVCYKCTDYYRPETEHTLRWDDPEVAIDWPIDRPVLSESDADGDSLDELAARGALPEYRE